MALPQARFGVPAVSPLNHRHAIAQGSILQRRKDHEHHQLDHVAAMQMQGAVGVRRNLSSPWRQHHLRIATDNRSNLDHTLTSELDVGVTASLELPGPSDVMSCRRGSLPGVGRALLTCARHNKREARYDARESENMFWRPRMSSLQRSRKPPSNTHALCQVTCAPCAHICSSACQGSWVDFSTVSAFWCNVSMLTDEFRKSMGTLFAARSQRYPSPHKRLARRPARHIYGASARELCINCCSCRERVWSLAGLPQPVLDVGESLHPVGM